MDFVARAGSVVQRAHAMIGLLLLVLLLFLFWIFSLQAQNNKCMASYTKTVKNASIYVVPGSTADMYAPTRDEMLLQDFVDHIARSMNTYTSEDLRGQYISIQKFFTQENLVSANKNFKKLLDVVKAEERSSLFIPDWSTYKIENKGGVFEVSLSGQRQYLLAGQLQEPVFVKISMSLVKTNISLANPFGYVVAKYGEDELDSMEMRVEKGLMKPKGQ